MNFQRKTGVTVTLVICISLFFYLLSFPLDFLKIFEATSVFVGKAWPIQFFNFETIAIATFETILMALSGTVVGFSVALVFAAASSYHNRAMRIVGKPTALLFRAIPDFAMALVLAQVLGIGPLAGALAIALGTFGISFKILFQIFSSPKTLSNVFLASIGSTNLHRFIAADLPHNISELLAQFSYRFEVNLRIATIIGITGAGGLGLLLRNSLGYLDYQKAFGIVLIILATILVFEGISRSLRSRLRTRTYSSFNNPSGIIGFAILLNLSFLTLVFWFVTLGNPFRLDDGLNIIFSALNFESYSMPSTFLHSILDSLFLVAATLGAAFVLALILGALSSQQLSRSNQWSSFFRFLTTFFRSVPTIIWALILIPAYGLGLEVASVAIIIGAGLFIAKLITEVFDSYSYPEIDTLSSIGARRLQLAVLMIRTSCRERILKSFFLLLDFTIRYSVILGILGVGGLGSELNNALRLQDYNSLTLVTLVLAIGLASVELIERLLIPKEKTPANENQRRDFVGKSS